MNILILYATTEGQTAKIAERMAEILRQKGHDVTAQSGEYLPDSFNPDLYDAAVIGGSIHMGRYPGYLNAFVSQYSDWLNTVPSAFFTVCMGIRSKQSESREEAATYSENFIKDTNWHPALTATFAGAVKYTQYNFITRFIMKDVKAAVRIQAAITNTPTGIPSRASPNSLKINSQHCRTVNPIKYGKKVVLPYARRLNSYQVTAIAAAGICGDKLPV